MKVYEYMGWRKEAIKIWDEKLNDWRIVYHPLDGNDMVLAISAMRDKGGIGKSLNTMLSGNMMMMKQNTVIQTGFSAILQSSLS